jgi:hypothetical protein
MNRTSYVRMFSAIDSSTAAAVRDLGRGRYAQRGHRVIVCMLWTNFQILRWPPGHSVDAAGWQRVLDRVCASFAGRFVRG